MTTIGSMGASSDCSTALTACSEWEGLSNAMLSCAADKHAARKGSSDASFATSGNARNAACACTPPQPVGRATCSRTNQIP